MRPLIIPFFIPHAGCPHTCLFCDQHRISGVRGPLPTPQQITATVHQWLIRSPGRPAQVAFYGGSFTLLPQAVQAELLEAVQPLINEKRVSGIRLSTRPDALDNDTLFFLAGQRVRTIEIGVQSLDDEVLLRANRGHTAQQSIESIKRVAAAGFEVGVQLLPGLPGDTPLKALESLRGVIAAGAQFLRIYPALVLSGTGLADLHRDGRYCPPDLEEGVRLCAGLLHEARQAGCPVIRVGLQSDDGLVPGENILAGCWHPALGQLVRGELFYELVLQRLSPLFSSNNVVVYCSPRRLSEVQGHGQRNLLRWQQAGLCITSILCDSSLGDQQLRLESINQKITLSTITDLNKKEFFYAQAVDHLS